MQYCTHAYSTWEKVCQLLKAVNTILLVYSILCVISVVKVTVYTSWWYFATLIWLTAKFARQTSVMVDKVQAAAEGSSI